MIPIWMRGIFSQDEAKRERVHCCATALKVAARVVAAALIVFAIFSFSIPVWFICLPVAYVFCEMSVVIQRVIEIQEAPEKLGKKEFKEAIFQYAPLFYPIHLGLMRIPRYVEAWNDMYEQYRNPT
ncbi:MAG: hypothetical protein JSS32_09215 [Verrucomicrobia bacterium]|nr:hypothetical protein [Verrucomicrobiota bacterium]